MSTTIDHQVVEMRFDNKQFESNVSTTMSTLDKLKTKLNMSGAAKGFDEINTSVKNVNMNPLGNAVESVSAKFSALQVMGVTALANITNSAVNAGKNIVKSLTIAPITTGFNEYELKMNSVQTIMASTGESLATVNQYLNELNEYSDKTIYSFQDMTSNIGKFTNAGVKLEDAVLAMQGISNEAALSGASANEASRAMYNFSQALSAGFVKLIDWKSIELANMATKEFKEQLIQTAVEVGTLKEGADGMYDVVNVISKANASSLNATKNFNDSLGNQWMTTEVLIETLRKYADETTDIGKKANEAATKVKTFTQLMDTLKESAQSGWAQTWELFVGDFEEARNLFTELSDIFGGIIGDSANRRNNFLGEVLNSNWEKLTSKINKAGIETSKFEEAIRNVDSGTVVESLVKKYGSLAAAQEAGVIAQAKSGKYIDSVVEKYGSLEKAVMDGAISVDILQEAFDNLVGTGADKEISSFVEGLKEIKRLLQYGSVGDDVKKLQTALDELGYDLGKPGIDGIIGPITEAAIKAFQKDHNLEIDGIVGPETLAALEEAGTKVNKLEGDVDDLKSSCKDLIKVITQKSGRELLLDSLLNIIKAIRKPLAAVGKAFGNIFTIKPTQLYNVIEGFNKFTKLLIINDDTSKKLQRTFEGLFAALKIITTIAGGAFKIAFKALSLILEKFDIGILDLTANIGDALVRISDFINGAITKGLGAAIDWLLPKITKAIEALKNWVKSLKDTKLGKTVIDTFKNWPDTLDKISKAFTDSIKAIKGWFSELKDTQLYKDVSGWFTTVGEEISNAVNNIKTSITNIDVSSISDKFQGIRDFFGGIVDSLKENEIVIKIIDGIKTAFNKVKEFFGKFKLPEFNIDNLNLFSKYALNFEESGLSGIGNMFKSFGEYWAGLRKFDWQVFKEGIVEKFVNFYLKTGDKIKAAFEKCKEIANAIKVFLFGTEEIDLPTIMDAAKKVLEILVLIEALKALKKVVAPLDNITDALDNLAASLKWAAVSDMFKSMAIALGVFTICLIVISSIDFDKAWKSAALLAGLMVVLGGVVSAIAFFAGKVDGGLNMAGAVSSLLMLVASIAILVYTLKEIDKLELKNPGKTFLILGGILLALTAGVKMISKAGGSSFRSVAAILTLMAALKLILEVIEDYDQFDWSGKSGAIRKMVEMLIALSIAINIASRGIKSGASASGLAFTILAMVISLKLILNAIEDFADTPVEDLKKGGVVVAAIFGLMTAMMAVANLTSKSTVLEKGQKSVNNFAGFAVALLAVVGAIWLLGKMDIATLKQGGTAVAGVLLMFTGMLVAIGKSCSGLKMGVIIALLISIGILMAELAVIIHKLKDIPWESSVSSAGSMVAMLLSIAGVLRVLTKHNIKAKSIFKWVGAMAALGIVIGLLGHILKVMRDVDPRHALANATALSGLLIAMAGCMVILTQHRNKPETIKQWALSMYALSGVMLVLALVMTMVANIEPDRMMAASVSLGALLISMAGCMAILTAHRNKPETIKKWAQAMYALSGVLIILAIVLNMVKDINPANAIGNVTALSILLAALTGVFAVLSKVSFNWSDFDGIAGFATVAASLLILVDVLNRMDGVDNAITNAEALSILAGALSACMVALAGSSKLSTAGGLGKTMIAFEALVVSLYGVVDVLQRMDGIENATENAKTLGNLILALSICVALLGVAGLTKLGPLIGAGALAIVMVSMHIIVDVLSRMENLKNAEANAKVLGNIVLALTIAMYPMSIAGMMITGALIGVGALAILMVSLHIVVDVLARMEGLSNARANAEVLANLMLALTLCLLPLSMLSVLIYPALAAAASLGIVILSLEIVVNVLQKMEGLQNAQGNVDILVGLITALSDVLVKIAAVAPMAMLASIALGILTTVVASIGGFVTAVGFLMENVPGLENFLDKGIAVFIKLAEGLGEMVGAFASAVTSFLPAIGENLSAFAENVGTFITVMSGVDESVALGCGVLIGAIIGFLAADFISGIASLAGVSLTDLAIDLSGFADNIGGFISTMSSVDPEMATSVSALCDALLVLTGANVINALSQLIPGDNTFSTFGQSISDFAVSIKDAAAALSDITDDDVANIKRSAAAGMALAELGRAIPAQGGWVDAIIGAQELGQFGASIVAFAKCIVDYSAIVTGDKVDKEAIVASADAGHALANLNGAIPAQGGWADAIMGAQELGQFGASIVAFAKCLVDYSAIVTENELDTEAIKSSAAAAGALAELNGKLPSQNGLYQAVMGEQNLADFGTQLVTFAEGIAAYAEVAATITEDKITAITNSGKAVDEILKVMDKVPEKANWWDNLWGNNKDGGSFGDAITAVANGINRFCTVAVEIADKTDSIGNVGTAIDNVKAALEKIPDEATLEKSSMMSVAVSDLKDVAYSINSITSAEYDYSGLTSLRTAIRNLTNMFNGVDTSALYEKYSSLYSTSTYVTKVAKEIAKLNKYTYEGIDRFKTALSSLSDTDVDGVINAFSGKAGEMKTAVSSIIDAMSEAIDGKAKIVSSNMEDLVQGAINAAKNKAKDFKTAGSEFATKLADGLKGGKSSASTAGNTVAAEAASGAKKGRTGMYNAGSSLVSGFASGISDNDYKAAAKAKAMAEKAVEAAREALAINSPSKVFRAIGYSVPEGFAMGIDRMGWMVKDSTVAMGNIANKSLSSTISRISNAISTDIDAQPTIRPVLDLSDIQAGASAIGGLLGGNASVGVMANVGTISTMMNRRSQNGGNADVVSALDRLSKKMDNINNASYHIDGITYDDGSNISEAVRTIVRAAKMERRV